MDDLLAFAVCIAQKAGKMLKDRLPERHQVDYKGAINLVTEADRRSEDILISEIRRRFPGHDILSEETPLEQTGAESRWVIDPLDGTTNYAHGYPVFCVSLAYEEKGSVTCGVVYGPVMDELFVARRGGGAFLNGQPLAVSTVSILSNSLLATGFPYDIRDCANNNMNYFRSLAMHAQAIRRAGSAALDMAYLAAGRFDGFWELKLMPWDTAAGWLLIEEAGGRVTDLTGSPFTLVSPHVLASNGRVHEDMLAVLRSTDPLSRDHGP